MYTDHVDGLMACELLSSLIHHGIQLSMTFRLPIAG